MCLLKPDEGFRHLSVASPEKSSTRAQRSRLECFRVHSEFIPALLQEISEWVMGRFDEMA
jgi:hypothetical protein